jgi:hypothetical protein
VVDGFNTFGLLLGRSVEKASMIINQALTILFLPYFFFQSFSFNFNLWRNKDRNFWLALTNKDSLYSWPYFSRCFYLRKNTIEVTFDLSYYAPFRFCNFKAGRFSLQLGSLEVRSF